MKCPFCDYERKPTDVDIPNWKCPSCEKAYTKYVPPIERQIPTLPVNKYKEGIGSLIFGVFFLFLVVSGLVSGETTGIGTAQVVGSQISISGRPLEFIFMILFQLFIGLWFVFYGIKWLRKK